MLSIIKFIKFKPIKKFKKFELHKCGAGYTGKQYKNGH